MNEAFVGKFDLGTRVIGTRLAMGRGNRELDIEIVGLVGDARYSVIREPPPPQLFLSARQADVGAMMFYVRTTSGTGALAALVPSEIGRLDANLPVVNLRTMDDQIWENTTRDRVLTTLSSWFAGLAILLAAIGLYAVLAYGVAQRLRELGIRIALGARSRHVCWLVLSQVGRMALVGGAVGGALALAFGRIGGALLFGVERYDAVVVGGAAVLVLVVGLCAGVLPARRATLVNPVEALRGD